MTQQSPDQQAHRPLVSVITATYNAASCLSACLDSVELQGSASLEHIVVDGGSTDGTVDILQQRNRPGMRWISERDRGIYDAWNKGIGMARGEWIAFLGADDLFLPGAVQHYLDLAAKHTEAEYLSSQVKHVSTGGRERLIGKPWSWPAFQRHMTVAHVGSMHRRSLYERYGQYDTSLRIVADYEFLLRPGPHLRAAYLPLPTVQMLGGGVSDSYAALREAATVKHRTGKRPRLQAEVEFWLAKMNLWLWRSGIRS